VSLVSITSRRVVVNPQDQKYQKTPIIWQCSSKYGIIPWCHTEGTLMGDEYTFDDYECIVESYDSGEVLDDQWGDEEYSQGDQYAAMADRHCV